MEVNIQHGEEAVVFIKWRLDTVTSAELDERLRKEEVEENVLVMDFSEVEYISSAGLRLLLSLKRDLEVQSKSLVVRHINDVVKEIFGVTGFINVLTIE